MGMVADVAHCARLASGQTAAPISTMMKSSHHEKCPLTGRGRRITPSGMANRLSVTFFNSTTPLKCRKSRCPHIALATNFQVLTSAINLMLCSRWANATSRSSGRNLIGSRSCSDTGGSKASSQGLAQPRLAAARVHKEAKRVRLSMPQPTAENRYSK
jgi:hypothetical protein